VRLWDLTTGAEQVTLTGHTNELNAAAFSPDGRPLASAGDDRTVRVWDRETGASGRGPVAHKVTITDLLPAPGKVYKHG